MTTKKANNQNSQLIQKRKKEKASFALSLTSVLIPLLYVTYRVGNDVFGVILNELYFIGTCLGFSALMYFSSKFVKCAIKWPLIILSSLFMFWISVFYVYYWILFDKKELWVYHAFIAAFLLTILITYIRWKR